jgi:hypothetical protein
MFTSAIGLCLAAPAFAQYSSGSPQPNGQAAPAASSQQQSQDRARQPATSGPAQNQSQPSQSGQAQNQQPSGSSNAQAPSSNQQQQQRAGDNQNQRDRNRDQAQDRNRDQGQDRNRDQAQRDRQPASDDNAASRDKPDDRQRADQPRRDRQMGQDDRRQQTRDRQRDDQRRDARDTRSPDRNAQDGRSRDRDRQDAQRDRDRDRNRQDARRDRDRDDSARVRLSDNQRTRISSVIRSANVRAIDVNFALDVGVIIPATVTLHPLPTTIVEIVPQFRGYSYFVTREEKIVIVEPRTKKIVHVVSEGGSARAQATDRRVRFSDREREVIRSRSTSLRSVPETTGSRTIIIEEEVPATIELQEFPTEIVTEVPEIRTYRYIRRDNEVLVVDPPSRRVIEIIR